MRIIIISLLMLGWTLGYGQYNQPTYQVISGAANATVAGTQLQNEGVIGVAIGGKATGGNYTVQSEFIYAIIPLPVQELFDSFLTSLFPNPVKTRLHVSWESSRPLEIQAEIYDLNGRRLGLSSGTKRPMTAFHWQVDVSHLPAGMYFVKLFDGKGSISKTLRFQKR